MPPTIPSCREQLAALRLNASDYAEAAVHFQLILRDGKIAKSVLDGLAYTLMKTGEYRRAIETSERSIRQFGPDSRVYAGLGYLYRCVGNLTAAVTNYRMARDLAAADPERNFDLGLALYLERDFSGAAAVLQEALRLRPGWGTAHYYLALTWWNLRQYPLALAHARQAQDQGVEAAKLIVRTLSANQK